MTEKELRQLVVNTAKKYLGANEGGAKHKEILSVYNNHKPLARKYAVQVKDSWCATFVSAIGILCDLTDIMPTECSCGHMVQLYNKKKRWQEKDSYRPQIGDIVMYDWEDTKGSKSDCVGWPDHVGIVAAINGSTMSIIEGNYHNTVKYRTLLVNGRYIRGYCLPDYASKASSTAASVPSQPEKKPEVSEDTYSLKQFIRDIQSCTGAKVDGIAGSETISKTITLSRRYNKKHEAVSFVQRRLTVLGYDVGESGIDGSFGPDTARAVEAFQKDHGCVSDGIITKRNKTWRKLLGME